MAKKKQFQKPIELSEDEIFVDLEAELEKEQLDRILNSKKEKQIYNIPDKTWYTNDENISHRLYLCVRYELDYGKDIGIDSEQAKVFNFDFNQRNGRTLPEYINSLGYSWTNFLNYDLVMEGNNNKLKEYLCSY